MPFSLSGATLYRNDALSDFSSISPYDVLYYNESLQTVWVYDDKMTGIYMEASPNAASPSSVTVGGKSYDIATSGAAYALSNQGPYNIGDMVTLLLDANGDIAGVADPSEAGSTHYGVVTAVSSVSYDDESTPTELFTLACTDGVERQFASSSFEVGDVVSADYSSGSAKLRQVGSSNNLSGTVSADGTSLGDRDLAANIQILDVSDSGDFARLYAADLAGYHLASDEILLAAYNSAGEVDHLILNDASGDVHDYGVLSDVSEASVPSTTGASNSLSGSYRYIIDGVTGVLNTQGSLLHAERGPSIFIRDESGSISAIRNLSSVGLDSINDLQATDKDGESYPVSRSVSAYIVEHGGYTPVSLASVQNNEDYRLTGYYDSGFAAGGKIRVVLAYAQ